MCFLGDMLEMILSSEQGRLSERITKFLVTQVSLMTMTMMVMMMMAMMIIILPLRGNYQVPRHPGLLHHDHINDTHQHWAPHHVDVVDPGGVEALAQQEHRPLRFETGKCSPLLRLRFPPGQNSHHHPHSELSFETRNDPFSSDSSS